MKAASSVICTSLANWINLYLGQYWSDLQLNTICNALTLYSISKSSFSKPLEYTFRHRNISFSNKICDAFVALLFLTQLHLVGGEWEGVINRSVPLVVIISYFRFFFPHLALLFAFKSDWYIGAWKEVIQYFYSGKQTRTEILFGLTFERNRFLNDFWIALKLQPIVENEKNKMIVPNWNVLAM